MSNPGHNAPFNQAHEAVNRDEQRGIMNTSREWDEAAEEARILDAEAEERIAERLSHATNTISAQIAETAPQLSSLAALEARRARLQQEIEGLEFDAGNRENSASTNFKISDDISAAQEELDEVEAQIKQLASQN